MADEPRREGPRDVADRVELIVPLQRAATSSPRRTWSAIAAWLLCLAAVIAFGLYAQVPQAERPPLAADPGTSSLADAVSIPTLGLTRAAAAVPRPAATPHRSLGDDGLIGGLPFRNAVARLSQADIERDGYRYYGQLLVGDGTGGRQGPP